MSNPTSPVSAPVAARRADLDWLRVLAVLLLVPFHSALVFMLDPGLVAYVKDTVESAALIQLKEFLDRWQLELLFFIAGAASWFALERRSAGQYLAERFRRLLAPFVFGLCVLVPLMINTRWLGRADAPSLSQIYARFFVLSRDITGMSGNFTPAHLWFILYLLVFSLVALPIFLLLRLPVGRRIVAALAAVPGVVYLFVIPLALARSVDLLSLGPKDPLYYLLLFLTGYILISQPRFQESIDRNLSLSLALALATTYLPRLLPLDSLLAASTAHAIDGLLYRLSQWLWVLSMLGAGHRWLNHDSPALRYASEAAYPFYIIHLPVDTLVAFYVVRLNTGIAVKYPLIVVATIVLSLAIYEIVIKRVDLLRFCFGMKPMDAVAPAPRSQRRPAP